MVVALSFWKGRRKKSNRPLGAVDVASSSINTFPDDDDVQCNAIYLLKELATNKDCAKYKIATHYKRSLAA